LVSIGRGRKAREAEACAPSLRRGSSLSSVLPIVKSLADENRLAIMTVLLGADGALCACDIEASFGLSQPTISHHMRVLREAGLVDADKRGAWVYYAPTPAARCAVTALVEAAALARG
jgi:ArsR family transcriptional regulator